MKFDVKLAIERATRRDALNEAERNATWVIRVPRNKRIPSKNEMQPKRTCDSASARGD